MNYYREPRNVELSICKFIEDSLAVDWSRVNFTKSNSELDKIANPVICLSLSDTNPIRKELGSTSYRKEYIITIDIFATSDGMRLDLSSWLMDKLVPGWVYYEISQDSGNNRTLVYTPTGRCRIDAIYENTQVSLGAMGAVKDKYRQNIIIAVTVGC